LQTFEYVKPKSLEEASSFIVAHAPEAVLFAGGTDLLVQMKDGVIMPGYLIDIKGIEGLGSISCSLPPSQGGIEGGATGLTIGATATLNAVAASPVVKERYGLLAQAAETIGSYPIRNRATLGGNICNASPGADTAPALLALDASVRIFGPNEERAVPLGEFFTGPGATVLKPGDILTAIQVPPPPLRATYRYIKLGRCAAVDLAIVGVAVLGFWDGGNPSGYGFRIALGAVAPTPIRVPRAEDILSRAVDDEAVERAATAAMEAAQPISDVRASKEYRSAMVRNLAHRGIRETLAELTIR
jgi:CO/xanthine dehydrogenase FAD-binding subunit